MNIAKTIELVEYEGNKYFTVRQFANCTNRSEKAVYGLIRKGNAIRKLKAIQVIGRTIIPESEFTEFVFTGPGKYPYADLYRFGPDGKQYPIDKEKFYGKETVRKESSEERSDEEISSKEGTASVSSGSVRNSRKKVTK